MDVLLWDFSGMISLRTGTVQSCNFAGAAVDVVWMSALGSLKSYLPPCFCDGYLSDMLSWHYGSCEKHISQC